MTCGSPFRDLRDAGGQLSRGEVLALRGRRRLRLSRERRRRRRCRHRRPEPVEPGAGAPPAILAWVTLPHGASDIVTAGDTAIVVAPSADPLAGTATLISLVDPLHPQKAGTLTGFRSRLGTSGGILFSSSRTFLAAPEPTAGLKTTALDRLLLIDVQAAGDPRRHARPTAQAVNVTVRTLPLDPFLKTARLDVEAHGVVTASQPVALPSCRASRPRFATTLARRSGRLSSYVLSHTYQHLGPLTGSS